MYEAALRIVLPYLLHLENVRQLPLFDRRCLRGITRIEKEFWLSSGDMRHVLGGDGHPPVEAGVVRYIRDFCVFADCPPFRAVSARDGQCCNE